MASMQGPIGGYATLTIDGTVWDVKGDIKYKVNGMKRETAAGQSGIAGYTEMPVQGSISATLFDRSDVKLSDLMNKSSSTVIARLANGKVITGNDMWLIEQPENTTQEGTFEVTFEGRDVTEDTV